MCVCVCVFVRRERVYCVESESALFKIAIIASPTYTFFACRGVVVVVVSVSCASSLMSCRATL